MFFTYSNRTTFGVYSLTPAGMGRISTCQEEGHHISCENAMGALYQVIKSLSMFYAILISLPMLLDFVYMVYGKTDSCWKKMLKCLCYHGYEVIDWNILHNAVYCFFRITFSHFFCCGAF